MSGRGRGRGGRGRSQGRSNYIGSARKENLPSKKSITDWNYYIGSAKQASEFEAITEFLLNYIREQFEFGNDIAKAIDDQEPVDTKIWRPSLQKSQSEDPETKKNENEEFRMEFQAALQTYQKRQSLYESNTIKAYALFWGRCTKGMRNKIEARTDYGTKIKNNPIELVKAIKEHSLSY
jgi:hypothetical protein